jgi:hypothetical protein
VKRPGVFVQSAFGSQPPLLVLHLSMSTHPALPVPVYPAGHALHVKLPGVFVHVVFASQPPRFVAHSSTSTHSVPRFS